MKNGPVFLTEKIRFRNRSMLVPERDVEGDSGLAKQTE